MTKGNFFKKELSKKKDICCLNDLFKGDVFCLKELFVEKNSHVKRSFF